MGRPPLGGGPVFRFTQNEVLEMEKLLQESNNSLPPRDITRILADKFSASADRAGKIVVQPKQVLNWFQNRRYARRARSSKGAEKLSISSMPRDDSVSTRNAASFVSVPSIARNSSDEVQVEFEAKSARDGAWYDIFAFISYRMYEAGDPEVLVRFVGLSEEEDEWINVLKCVRQRSLPCEPSECAVVLPGDLVLCFQEGKEQALYFDAHVLDAQRRRHDSRGCRCRFLVRYDHDQSEEIVPLRKVCRRPETDYRLKIFHTIRASGAVDTNASLPGSSKDVNLALENLQKQPKPMDVNTEEVTILPLSHSKETTPTNTTIEDNSTPETLGDDASQNDDDDDDDDDYDSKEGCGG
ncbi:hypothetical protein J5N97_024880 [Dioscorea zingiberensis]|uniref:Homeobox domain-containing protein n=1 Tax=Dioscorea zingiberensis TaxID=325984 RepID=A0A9D5C828_9LILI|nr:hypothetical protein J5N97_024880 [Dioscorea zingiberensis]